MKTFPATNLAWELAAPRVGTKATISDSRHRETLLEQQGARTAMRQKKMVGQWYDA